MQRVKSEFPGKGKELVGIEESVESSQVADGKLLGAGVGAEAQGSEHPANEISKSEEAMKNGRRNVIGKIAVDTDAAASRDSDEIRFKNVAGNYRQIGIFSGEALETRDEWRVELDGVNGRASGGEMPGYFAVAGANLDPARVFRRRPRAAWPVRRDADGARDLFAPVSIGEEMLAKALPSHTAKKCSRKIPEGERRQGQRCHAPLVGQFPSTPLFRHDQSGPHRHDRDFVGSLPPILLVAYWSFWSNSCYTLRATYLLQRISL